jgi:uncharacterized membrane protein
MSLAVLSAALLSVIGLAGVVVLALLLLRRPDPAPSEAAEAARRHGSVVNLTAWLVWFLLPAPVILVVAVGVFRASAGTGQYAGVVTALYPATHGLLYLAVHAIGERTWPRPAGPVRRAELTRRRVADVAPRHLRAVTWAWVGLLAVALAVGWATAAPDGRSFDTPASGSMSLYPGWYYGAWLLPAALLVLAATEVVLRLVAARPAIVDADPPYDAASRRLSAHRVLRGPQLVLGLTLAGVVLVLGYGPHHAGLHVIGYALGVVAVGVALAAAALAAIPAQPPPGWAAHLTGRPRVAVPAGHGTAVSTAKDATDLPS